MKKTKIFFIVTDVQGNVLSEELEFLNEQEAIEWAKNQDFEDRIFIEKVTEIV